MRDFAVALTHAHTFRWLPLRHFLSTCFRVVRFRLANAECTSNHAPIPSLVIQEIGGELPLSDINRLNSFLSSEVWLYFIV